MALLTRCPDCGTALGEESWTEGLCPGCLLELALQESTKDGQQAAETEATLEFPSAAGRGKTVLETLSSQQILGERYRVRSLLGRGGMGEVWRAYDLKLRVDVALKALRPELLEDKKALETLRQEVRTAREVISPNVCRVFQLEELDGREVVSMEYIDGTTLTEILRNRGPLELEEAREITSQFLAGLEAIHDAGLVHRDVKPENLMITRAGRVVVMDFGIAKGLVEKKKRSVAGTPAYMSQEQALGKEVDARADVFSAGVVMAEMIAPEGVRDHQARQALWRAIHAEPPELPDTPWAAVIRKAVARDREERYRTASALARALEEVALRVEGAEELFPYPGLAAFTEEDAEYFFGRELEVEAMWKKLRRPHLLALIGPSGAGKSSFLRAGLIPTMPEGWRAVISTPGNRPFRALAQRLVPEFEGDTEAMTALLDLEEIEVAVPLVAQWRERHKHALVILDQFEELFTLNPPEVQEHFSDLLGRLALEADVHVLLSMRDDFLFHCHAHEALAPILSELTLLGPPAGAALRRAVVQPALKCGYRFEDEALIEEILTEVEDERGALPMLAFSAARLWEKRDRDEGLLTREAYQEIGGVAGSLAQHAEATLERIGSERIPIVRELFRNLVTAQGTRAARDREELLSIFDREETADRGVGRFNGHRDSKRPDPVPAAVGGGRESAAQILNALIDARLVTSYEVPPAEDEDTGHRRIEIIHESLLTNWPRLVRWQSQDADSALLRDELRQAAQTWDQHDRSDDLLWTGTAFREYQLWRERYPGGLTEAEEDFAQAMTTHAQRRKRRRRIAVTAAMVFLTVVLTLVSTLWRQSETAKEEAVAEARRAEAAKLLALGRLELDTFSTAAVAYALASLELADTEEARRFAVEALWRGPTASILTPPGEYADWQSLDFSPDGRWLALASQSENVLVWSEEGGSPRLLGGHGGGIYGVQFSSEQELLITSSWRAQRLQVWSSQDWSKVGSQEFDRPTWVSQRGKELLTFTLLSDEKTLLIRSWPLGGGEPTILASWNIEGVGPITTDPSGTSHAYGLGKRVYLKSLAGTKARRDHLVGRHDAEVIEIAFDPSGSLLAATDKGGEIRLWSLEDKSASPLRVLEAGPGIDSLSVVLAFDPTGSKLALSTMDEGVRVWDLEGSPHAEPLILLGQKATQYWEPAFHPSGRWLAAPAGPLGVILWPLARPYSKVLEGHEASVTRLIFAPDGRWLASASFDRTVRRWPMQAGDREGKPTVLFEAQRGISGIAIDPRGQRLLVGEMRPPVSLVTLGQGAVEHLPGFTSAVNIDGLAFSTDGRLAAAGPGYDTEGTVIRVWDLDSGEVRVLDPGPDPKGEFTRESDNVIRIGFLPDGRLVSAGFRGVRLWNLDEDTSTFIYENKDADHLTMSLSANRKALIFKTGNPGEAPHELFFHDLKLGSLHAITSHDDRVSAVALDPSGTIAVTGDEEGVVRVGLSTGEEPHLLLGHRRRIWDLAVSPDGRWIASGDQGGAIRIWPMPDMSKPPFHTLPYEELLAKLSSLTNLRVIEDEASATGYKVEPGHFPGWGTVPTW